MMIKDWRLMMELSYPYGTSTRKVFKTEILINFDYYTDENKAGQSKMAIYSRSSI